ncbi:hypothetical protein QR680_005825 [Steinernema hermaphroditum]|uniref:PH domain-containing protein n=1 Tax=Steinernema hermaphroditum TaxID=289476 RepID=A0AA39HTH8_9BILA|nr:hypothetical protein QR680_005825 [Steinernema hermaphroditum]
MQKNPSPPGSSAESPTSPCLSEELVTEKSAKIKRWVKNRLQELEEQNERLRAQNLKCTSQLKALTSCADKNRHWRKSQLFSHSVTGALPTTLADLMDTVVDRTSDDSGLTSDDTTASSEAQKRLQLLQKADSAAAMALMTKSSSAAIGSPRSARKQAVRMRSDATTNSGETQSSTTDSSPWEEKPKPIPTPRRTKQQTAAQEIGGFTSGGTIERDSLNSYDVDDDYGEYEDEDEIFEEIEYDDSPLEEIDCRRDMRYRDSKCADYVNLTEFCTVRDGDSTEVTPLYTDIIKPKSSPESPLQQPPQLPQHRPFMQWTCDVYSLGSRNSGPKSVSPYCIGSPQIRTSATSSERHHDDSSEYAIPPDASNMHLDVDIRTSLVPSARTMEKCGYLTQMSDSRLKSLKRRFVVLKDGCLKFYRTQKNQAREEEPLMRISIQDVKSVTRLSSRNGSHGLQISSTKGVLQYTTDSEKTTDEWVALLNQAIKVSTISEMAQRSKPVDALLSGWVYKVKHGHSKKYHARLDSSKLFFYKGVDDKIPSSHLYLKGATICEKSRCSSDEYSGSSDEHTAVAAQLEMNGNDGNCSARTSSQGRKRAQSNAEYSICIEIPNTDPVYLMLRTSDDKDKWLYYLKMMSRDGLTNGTQFENFVQKLMIDGGRMSDPIWIDPIFAVVEERLKGTLTTIEDEAVRKKAIELDKACYLFTSVLMRAGAVQYHVDLAQNILTTALEHESLQNELFAQLIRLTSGSMPYGLQAWKLMALAIPLYLPKQYSLLWLLRRHIERWSTMAVESSGSKSMSVEESESKMAGYCGHALERSLKVGGRVEGPSKFEATTILARDPCATKLPLCISVQIPSGDYQVIEFDGSTEVGQCLSSLCLKLGLRPALLSGYALYCDTNPGGRSQSDEDLILLKGKQKLCDCMTAWERQARDKNHGPLTEALISLRLKLRMRHHWRALAHEETPMERLLLCHRMAEEITLGQFPMSNELAEEICALYAQMNFSDCSGTISDLQFAKLTARCYPKKMLEVACERTLRMNIQQNWNQLVGVTPLECVRMMLAVLRKWKFFGSYVKPAREKMNTSQLIYIALNDSGLHMLSNKQMELVRSFPYHKLVSFGEFHNDFMVTVTRETKDDEETPRERLTFAMDPKHVEQLTCHVAEYMRCQKLVWKMSTMK